MPPAFEQGFGTKLRTKQDSNKYTMRDCDNNRQNVSRVSVFRNKPGPFLFLASKNTLRQQRDCFFFLSFLNIKVKLFKTVLFFWICTILGLLRHVFPSCSAVTAHSWNAPHDETESRKTRRISGEDRSGVRMRNRNTEGSGTQITVVE